MKEFLKTNTVTYNLMSFTGFKSLVIFSLFLDGPKSYEEIRDFFTNHEYIKEDFSIDAFRVYLTSLKKVGCDIQKMKKCEGGKYKMFSHPFELKITDEQISALVKVYKILTKTVDVKGILDYENFIIKLSKYSKNKILLETINKVSIFKKYDKSIIEKFIEYAKNNSSLKILYNSPNSSIKEIEFIAKDVILSENKLYVAGISFEHKNETTYLIDRIEKIINVNKKHKKSPEIEPIIVGYELSNSVCNTKLGENDTIVEIKDDSVVVETKTTNLFYTKQKILEYGADCTVLYPKEFRKDIIQTLLRMKEGYAND